MNTTLLCATALLWGCMAPAPAVTATPTLAAGDAILPPATRALVVPGTEEEATTLLELLREFADCTGQKLLLDKDSRHACDNTEFSLLAGVEVPAAEVYPFVESILAHHDVFISPLKGGEVPLLGVYPLGTPRRGRLTTFTFVRSEDVAGLMDHPALLVQTVLLLPNTDVRQLSTSFRTLFADQQRQSMVPSGEHSVLIRGAGREVAECVEYLRIIDETSAVRVETPEPSPAVHGGR